MTYEHYTVNCINGVWCRIGHSTIGYSDGDETEARILSALQRCRDVSAHSEDIHSFITNWAEEYHFSHTRHNLLRPFDLAPETQVLELGCGCGALTRYLGEHVAHVVSVEGSLRRAGISRERCRDLDNVTVVCDNLDQFQSDEKFDYVTLVGVLEYAPIYVGGSNPIISVLKKSRGFLKDSGALVLAIENQLGLKYFNGCAEDHIGAAYYGLHGLYRSDEPTTFGREALAKMLAAAGLPHQRFYYPFPDYKLPKLIFSDTAFSTPGFEAAALLMGMASRNAEGGFHPNFHENLAWRPIIENGLLPQLANSFLILAAESEAALQAIAPTWLASTYTADRIPAYATETRFQYSNAGIIVEKRLLNPHVQPPVTELAGAKLLHRADTVQDYVAGRPYLLELQQRLGRGEGMDAVIEWAAPWLDLLDSHASISGGERVLPGGWIDAIPQNFICAEDGSLRRIDEEWTIEGPVPLVWVVIRGLVNALAMSPTSPALGGMNLQEVVSKTSFSRGIILTESAYIDVEKRESKLRSLVYGDDIEQYRQSFVSCLKQPPRDHLSTLFREHHNNVISNLEKEIDRVKSTVSWQVTKPLRLLAFLWRKLVRADRAA